MPNRLLRDCTNSDKIDSLSVEAERFFYRLIMKVDDFGCLHADPRLLKSSCFPLIVDNKVTTEQISAWIQELIVAGVVISYESVGKPYLQILDFNQKLERKVSRYPGPGHQNHVQNGYVFFFGHQGGNVFRLGFSANPWARLREANNTAEQIVVLRMMYKGTTDDEKSMHDLLRNFTTNGKIYTLPQDVITELTTSYEQKKTAEQTIVAARRNLVVLRSATEVEVEVEVLKLVEAPKVAAPEKTEISSPPEKPATDQTKNSTKRKRIAGGEKFVPPTEQQCIDYFTAKCYNPKNPGTWFPDRCKDEATSFYNHYNTSADPGTGQWFQKSGQKIRNWNAAANQWISREKKGVFDAPVNSQPVSKAPVKETIVARERSKELPQRSKDLNYLYEKYIENPELMTTKSVDAVDYDYLKPHGLVNFNKDETTRIRTEATQLLQKITQEPTEPMILQAMKKIGLLEAFKRMHTEGRKIIFEA